MRKQQCPIGLECLGNFCPNYHQCFDLCISWKIPYYIRDDALIVRSYGWRCDWDDQAHGADLRFCPLPSGSYKVLDGSDHEFEMKTRLREAWLNAGWAAAVPITDKPCSSTRTEDQETISVVTLGWKPQDDIDDIPF